MLTLSPAQSEPLQCIYDVVAQARSLATTDVLLIYERRRAYPFATPSSLNMRPGGTYAVQAWKRQDWEGRDVERDDSPPPVAPPLLQPVPAALGLGPALAVPERARSHVPSSPPTDSQSSGLKLTLRGPNKAECHLQVPPETRILKLLRQYWRKHNVPAACQEGTWLEFDGERLERGKTVGEYEVEDEEVLDFRGWKG